MAPKRKSDFGQSIQAPKTSSKKDAGISSKPTELTQRPSETSEQLNHTAVIRPIKFTRNEALDSVSSKDNTVCVLFSIIKKMYFIFIEILVELFYLL